MDIDVLRNIIRLLLHEFHEFAQRSSARIIVPVMSVRNPDVQWAQETHVKYAIHKASGPRRKPATWHLARHFLFIP